YAASVWGMSCRSNCDERDTAMMTKLLALRKPGCCNVTNIARYGAPATYRPLRLLHNPLYVAGSRQVSLWPGRYFAPCGSSSTQYHAIQRTTAIQAARACSAVA